MNAHKLELVTRGILDRTQFNIKKAHRFALAALTGKPCPLCDGVGVAYVEHRTGETVYDTCPVCVSIEEARQC